MPTVNAKTKSAIRRLDGTFFWRMRVKRLALRRMAKPFSYSNRSQQPPRLMRRRDGGSGGGEGDFVFLPSLVPNPIWDYTKMAGLRIKHACTYTRCWVWWGIALEYLLLADLVSVLPKRMLKENGDGTVNSLVKNLCRISFYQMR